MCRSKRELLMKLQALINKYRGANNFVLMMDEWPKTIRALVFNSTPLMIRLGMLMPLDNYELSETSTSSLVDKTDECRKGNHRMVVIASYLANNISMSGPFDSDDTYIRWCEVCGAVVGDIESDNRLQPGAVFKMKLPEISK